MMSGKINTCVKRTWQKAMGLFRIMPDWILSTITVEFMKVSVIATFYNQEKYARKCIDSIVGHDGSTDRSGAICDECAEIDGRIQVIHKENGGVTSARNAGLSIADGDYVSFVDGDDYIEPKHPCVFLRGRDADEHLLPRSSG